MHSSPTTTALLPLSIINHISHQLLNLFPIISVGSIFLTIPSTLLTTLFAISILLFCSLSLLFLFKSSILVLDHCSSTTIFTSSVRYFGPNDITISMSNVLFHHPCTTSNLYSIQSTSYSIQPTT